jgi:hypothetical protein
VRGEISRLHQEEFMEKELEQFQQEAQRLKEGRKGGALPFPEALRAFAVRYAEQTLAPNAARAGNG